jgi:hypothetical protein
VQLNVLHGVISQKMMLFITTAVKTSNPTTFMLVSYSAYFFDPEDGGDVSPKRRLTFNGLHGIIARKIEPFITTAVGTSNPAGYVHIISFGWLLPRGYCICVPMIRCFQYVLTVTNANSRVHRNHYSAFTL